MATKTKASTEKKSYALKEIIFDIPPSDQRELLESAGFEFNLKDPKQIEFIEKLKIIRGKEIQGLEGIKNYPLLSNVMAELETISELSIDLIERLSPQKISVTALNILNHNKQELALLAILEHGAGEAKREKLDLLSNLLFDIAHTAKQTTLEYNLRHKRTESGGLKKKAQSHYSSQFRNILIECLKDLYIALAPYYNDPSFAKENDSTVLENFMMDFIDLYEEKKNNWVKKR